MKWNEFRKKAEKQGFKLVRHGKKHDVYCHPEKGEIQIERHGSQEMKKGIQNYLLKRIGL